MTEDKIEKHIRKIIRETVLIKKPNFEMLDNKDVFDIVICDNNNPSKLFFIEVKHYSKRNNRMGFGDGNGNGYQPEILSKRPKYFEDHLIWVFQKEDNEDYYVLKNEDCMNYISGEKIEIKQNNFQTSIFSSVTPMLEKVFLQYVENWLTGKK